MHKTFKDPSKAVGSYEQIMRVFEHVMDEIQTWLEETFEKDG